MDISLYEPRIGFEVECGSPWSRYETLRKLCSDLGEERYRDGAPAFTGWRAVRDVSLQFNNREATELISPVMPYRYGMSVMSDVFRWMKDNQFQTNSSCGFHVGLSIINMEDIDPVKLVMLLNENAVLGMFNRDQNQYCKNIKYYFRNYRLDRIEDLKTRFVQNVGETKYRFVNFLKLYSNDPYLEFRAIGGADYHNRFNDVEICIDHFLSAMIDSTDPENAKDIFELRFSKFREGTLQAL
jgi:hypothetical protein